MTGLSHAMISWTIAQGGGDKLRDRRIITWMGILPDADAIAYVIGAIPNLDIDEGYVFFVSVHHRYTHGLVMLLAAALFAAVFARRKLRTALLTGIVVIGHLLCDLVASGPEFPIYPFWPFDKWICQTSIPWTVSWSIPVQEWPNLLAGFVLLVAAFGMGRRIGRTPLEAISLKMDEELLRQLP